VCVKTKPPHKTLQSRAICQTHVATSMSICCNLNVEHVVATSMSKTCRNNNSNVQDFAVHCKMQLTTELMFKLLGFCWLGYARGRKIVNFGHNNYRLRLICVRLGLWSRLFFLVSLCNVVFCYTRLWPSGYVKHMLQHQFFCNASRYGVSWQSRTSCLRLLLASQHNYRWDLCLRGVCVCCCLFSKAT
jgi:hypothetical protein